MWVSVAIAVLGVYVLFDRSAEIPSPADDIQSGRSVPESSAWTAQGSGLSNEASLGNLGPPIPEFIDLERRLAYLRWLGAMSGRLQNTKPEWLERKEFLQTVWYESKRAGLQPHLVLGLIQVSSNFRKFYVREDGARGYMAVLPVWSKRLGDGDTSKLFHMQTNLRHGCVLMRHFLDGHGGDVTAALRTYYRENSKKPDAAGERAFVQQVATAAKAWLFIDARVTEGG